MRKSMLVVFLTVLMISGLAFVNSALFGKAQSGINAAGIINSDTTWTKANSPYNLVGPVGVTTGVTLTIQAGVTVNLNSYYLQVNGTLAAIGTSTEPIYINGGGVMYGISLTSTSSNSIIQNTVINSNIPPAIFTNSSAHIFNNIITGIIQVDSGSPVIRNNVLTGRIVISRGSATISNNFINDSCVFSGGPAISAGGFSIVSNNTIVGEGEDTGVYIWENYVNPTITDNSISNFQTGIEAFYSATIEGNLIVNNGIGINVGLGTNIIQNNTIAYNSIGINSPKPSSTIIYNNIQNNSNYNIYLDVYSSSNVTAAYNWWGTADIALANQTLNYQWSGFDIVTVNFLPLLTSTNPEAPILATTIPTSTIPEFPTWISLLLAFSATLSFIALKKRQSGKKLLN